MASSDFRGKELEAAWLKFIGKAAPAGEKADKVGIDFVAATAETGKFLAVQVKSSVHNAVKHAQQGLNAGRLIPVVVGDPAESKEQCLDALCTRGFWVTPSLRNSASELEDVYNRSQDLVVRACDKYRARELCRV